MAIGETLAGPSYCRFLSDCHGWVQVGEERLELAGEIHWEYMVISLRSGQIPGSGRRLSE